MDDEGLPVTAAIDMMDSDDGSNYFLTAKGKITRFPYNHGIMKNRDCDQSAVPSGI